MAIYSEITCQKSTMHCPDNHCGHGPPQYLSWFFNGSELTASTIADMNITLIEYDHTLGRAILIWNNPPMRFNGSLIWCRLNFEDGDTCDSEPYTILLNDCSFPDDDDDGDDEDEEDDDTPNHTDNLKKESSNDHHLNFSTGKKSHFISIVGYNINTA